MAALAAAMAGCSDGDLGVRPNLILISIDTLRADHLGCYGYPLPTSPFLDALSKREDAVLFEYCIAQAPNTAPSHMSIFTSLYPTVHGVPNVSAGSGTLELHLPAPVKPLALVLRESGYRTAGLTDGGYMEPSMGFGQGFDSYDCTYERIARKVDRALSWIDGNASGKEPFFLFLHTYEVHGPYIPPPPFDERFTGDYDGWIRDYCFGPGSEKILAVDGFGDLFKRRSEFTEEDVAYLKALYDGEIAHMDSEMQRLFSALEQRGILDDTVVAILSDHGEEFGEHGEFSHKQLYDEVVRVPLILLLPGDRSGIERHRVEEQVSLIDVMPTLLELLHIESPACIQGTSLTGLWQGRGTEKPRPAFSEFIDFGPKPPLCAVRTRELKLLNYRWGKHLEVYDLVEDRGETRNRMVRLAREGKKLFLRLNKWHKANLALRKKCKAAPEGGELDPELIKRLRQLGYGD